MLGRGDTSETSSLVLALGTWPTSESLWKDAPPHWHVALQLPPELLQKIFLFLAHLSFPLTYLSLPGQPPWIAITYVCRYWRSAALGLLELWSSITPDLSASWSWAMMERSAPLLMRIDISIGASCRNGLGLLAASELLTTTSRIRTLRLSGGPNDIVRVLRRLRSPSPLESLSLMLIARDGQSVDLPKAFFGRKAPNLRYLTFEKSPACINAPRRLLTRITHFTTSASTELFELLMVLGSMPLLEVLRIEHIYDVWDDTDPPLRVPLRRLSLLSFHDDTPRRLVILSSRIDAPPTLRKQLFWQKGEVRSWNRLANMFRAVPALVPPDSAPGIDDGGLRVACVTGGPERGSLEVWSRTVSGSVNVSAFEEALFSFRVSWSGSSFDLRVNDPSARPSTFSFFFLARLCAHLRTARIEFLSIMPGTAIDTWSLFSASDVAEQWKALLIALPSVKTLCLYSSPECVSVLRVLSVFADPLLLPHLHSVFVIHCTVHCAAAAAPPDSVGATGASTAVANHEVNIGTELVEAVSARSGLRVVLFRCAVDDEALGSLQERAQVIVIRD
ncbi:hypothetical protein EDB83DRAFT_2329461 [Lactarius deliciosus]|nr:hypothetical protein EDB83DRAFT_2329461 [Lactarius deliciosus]